MGREGNARFLEREYIIPELMERLTAGNTPCTLLPLDPRMRRRLCVSKP